MQQRRSPPPPSTPSGTSIARPLSWASSSLRSSRFTRSPAVSSVPSRVVWLTLVFVLGTAVVILGRGGKVARSVSSWDGGSELLHGGATRRGDFVDSLMTGGGEGLGHKKDGNRAERVSRAADEDSKLTEEDSETAREEMSKGSDTGKQDVGGLEGPVAVAAGSGEGLKSFVNSFKRKDIRTGMVGKEKEEGNVDGHIQRAEENVDDKVGNDAEKRGSDIDTLNSVERKDKNEEDAAANEKESIGSESVAQRESANTGDNSAEEGQDMMPKEENAAVKREATEEQSDDTPGSDDTEDNVIRERMENYDEKDPASGPQQVTSAERKPEDKQNQGGHQTNMEMDPSKLENVSDKEKSNSSLPGLRDVSGSMDQQPLQEATERGGVERNQAEDETERKSDELMKTALTSEKNAQLNSTVSKTDITGEARFSESGEVLNMAKDRSDLVPQNGAVTGPDPATGDTGNLNANYSTAVHSLEESGQNSTQGTDADSISVVRKDLDVDQDSTKSIPVAKNDDDEIAGGPGPPVLRGSGGTRNGNSTISGDRTTGANDEMKADERI